MVKFLVLGDHQTGKTSVIRRFIEDRYTTHYVPTIGCDFARKTVHVSGVDYHIELWDLIGRDRVGGVAKVYYRKALGVILVCDADKPMFSSLMKWKEDIDEKLKLGNGNPVPVILMMNKCDSLSKPIDKAKMDKFCEKFGIIAWFEASAKEGKGVTDGVYSLLNAVLSEDQVIVHERAREGEDDITFDTEDEAVGIPLPVAMPSLCVLS